MDQGEQAFTLRLFGAPALTRKQVAAAADALNKPVITTPHVSRDGTAPHAGQWLDVTTDTSAIGTLKMAEDGGEAIIRAVELDGISDTINHDGTSLPIPARGIISARLSAKGLKLSDGLER
ncbi:hypothetical protein PSQ90_05365 [Devosia rhodophyticola]|uniref:Uncharacterized protein n=1 Tax=Devosia rhodophyticola TaxID=3026423 RepID=A0ABY7Z0W5_9HYPH|nr:hypothetical protein [Devosia rhodophyticola]WDR06880.1 hypothetical protein PSQ90_05365 [Devosia rhodophyticola]